jgi:hypothetical protein
MDEFREVEIPKSKSTDLEYVRKYLRETVKVKVKWICPECGEKRGDVYQTWIMDGSYRVHCDGWKNPCGHIDPYWKVLEEAQALSNS